MPFPGFAWATRLRLCGRLRPRVCARLRLRLSLRLLRPRLRARLRLRLRLWLLRVVELPLRLSLRERRSFVVRLWSFCAAAFTGRLRCGACVPHDLATLTCCSMLCGALRRAAIAQGDSGLMAAIPVILPSSTQVAALFLDAAYAM